MIKQIKFSLHMLRYGYGKAPCFLCGIVFLLFGLVTEFSAAGASQAIKASKTMGITYAQLHSSFLICISGFFVMQPWQTLNTVKSVAASPRNKEMLCIIPTIFAMISTVGGFTLAALLRIVLHALFRYDRLILIGGLYLTVTGILMLLLYMVFAYYYFISSIIAFYISFLSLHGIAAYVLTPRKLSIFSEHCPVLFCLPVTLTICYAVLALGVLVYYRLALRLRKKPFSKWAQTASLRKYL